MKIGRIFHSLKPDLRLFLLGLQRIEDEAHPAKGFDFEVPCPIFLQLVLRNLQVHFPTVLQTLEEVIQADDLAGVETQHK